MRSPWIWIGVLALTGGFQIFRGAPADAIGFGLMAVLLTAEATGLLARTRVRFPAIPLAIVVVAATVVGFVLIIAPLESSLDRVVLILVGAGLFLLVWPDPRTHSAERSSQAGGGQPIAPDALRRTGIVWGLIAVAICVWELINYFLGAPSAQATQTHPTISSLVEPFVGWSVGRIIFVAVWMLASVLLLRKGRGR
jgi:hypothetical protein